MAVQGLHLLITYKCNARCGHCFLQSGPDRRGSMSRELALGLVREAAEIPEINHLFIEGGEPFLYRELMTEIIERATGAGLWIGALSNGFWASSPSKAAEVLRPMAKAGLQSLSISTDDWHSEFIPRERAIAAARAASDVGIEADIMACERPILDNSNAKQELEIFGGTGSIIPVYTGGVKYRGRASFNIGARVLYPWEMLTDCRENPADPGRVHIGPDGEIHLCQGLLLGRSAGAEKLSDILGGFKPEDHQLVAPLTSGGPAELARLALTLGWKPRAKGYADGCHLCYEARCFLRVMYPDLIGPAAMYVTAA